MASRLYFFEYFIVVYIRFLSSASSAVDTFSELESLSESIFSIIGSVNWLEECASRGLSTMVLFILKMGRSNDRQIVRDG